MISLETITIIFFLALIVSAPWVSRKWGCLGELTWATVAILWFVGSILLLG